MCRLTSPDQIWRLTLCARRSLADAGRVGHQHLSRNIAALLGLAHLLLPVARPFPSTSAGSSSGILALTERSVPGVRTPWRDFARFTAAMLAHTIRCLLRLRAQARTHTHTLSPVPTGRRAMAMHAAPSTRAIFKLPGHAALTRPTVPGASFCGKCGAVAAPVALVAAASQGWCAGPPQQASRQPALPPGSALFWHRRGVDRPK